MNNQIVLIVRFWVTARSKPVFVEKLKTVFDQIQHEATFVNASLQEDVDHPEQLLVYEVWQGSREAFLQHQMRKPYRIGFERAILDLKVERSPQWLTPVARWK